MSRRRNKYYDRKLKLQAVQDYLGGGGSLRTICKKHGIKDKKQLRNWIKWYNGHKEIKERRAAGTEIYMTKGRKTTEKERAEIVAFCIKHGKNYPLTIKTYGVCALPGFVDSKNEEKTERNAGYLVVSHSGGGMLRQGTRKGIRRTPANRGMRAHWVVKGLDISEDVCHGMCP